MLSGIALGFLFESHGIRLYLDCTNVELVSVRLLSGPSGFAFTFVGIWTHGFLCALPFDVDLNTMEFDWGSFWNLSEGPV